MSEHYYTENPKAEHDERIITYEHKGKELTFITDAGVFSKHRVDFGTNLMINTIEVPIHSVKMLDVGCGYGPIGVSLASANPQLDVMMIDVNGRAVKLARRNIKRNRLKNATAMHSKGFGNVTENYDIIVTNPPIRAGKEVIYSMFEDSFRHLNLDGCLYVVIQKKQGGPSAQDKLTETFGNCEKVNKKAGYWILKSIKRS